VIRSQDGQCRWLEEGEGESVGSRLDGGLSTTREASLRGRRISTRRSTALSGQGINISWERYPSRSRHRRLSSIRSVGSSVSSLDFGPCLSEQSTSSGRSRSSQAVSSVHRTRRSGLRRRGSRLPLGSSRLVLGGWLPLRLDRSLPFLPMEEERASTCPPFPTLATFPSPPPLSHPNLFPSLFLNSSKHTPLQLPHKLKRLQTSTDPKPSLPPPPPTFTLSSHLLPLSLHQPPSHLPIAKTVITNQTGRQPIRPSFTKPLLLSPTLNPPPPSLLRLSPSTPSPRQPHPPSHRYPLPFPNQIQELP